MVKQLALNEKISGFESLAAHQVHFLNGVLISFISKDIPGMKRF